MRSNDYFVTDINALQFITQRQRLGFETYGQPLTPGINGCRFLSLNPSEHV